MLVILSLVTDTFARAVKLFGNTVTAVGISINLFTGTPNRPLMSNGQRVIESHVPGRDDSMAVLKISDTPLVFRVNGLSGF